MPTLRALVAWAFVAAGAARRLDFKAAHILLRLRDLAAQPSPTSVAIFLSGVPDRMLVAPMLDNVIRANAEKGVAVDLYLCLAGHPAKGTALFAGASGNKNLYAEQVGQYAVDPVMSGIISEGGATNTSYTLESLCRLAQAAGAVHCEGHEESSEPLDLPNDTAHNSSIYFYSPYTTQAGAHLLRRWESLQGLWHRAQGTELSRGRNYSSVLVIRDDAYWGAPQILDYNELIEDPSTLFTIPCMLSYGLNDKVLHMGRRAADSLMDMYDAWINADDALLQGCRSAEQFLGRLAMQRGINTRPLGMPAALASYTDTGLICFRKQHFSLPEGYHSCYGEDSDDGSFSKFYHELSCNDMKQEYFGLVPPENVTSLHAVVQKLAGPERRPIILAVVDFPLVNMTMNMLNSLLAVGEKANCLIVGTQAGVCGEFEELAASAPTVHCIDFPLRELPQVVAGTFAWGTEEYGKAVALKHVILTIILLSGYSEGVLFTDSDIVYLKPPLEELRSYAPTADLVFSTNNALAADAKTCDAVAEKYTAFGIESLSVGEQGAHPDINTGLIYLRQTTAANQLLLRTLVILAQEIGQKAPGRFQQYSMTEAIKAMPSLRLVPLPCDRFLNGNVIFGHPSVLVPENVVSVHANWMHSSLKRSCFELLQLWGDSANFSTVGPWWENLQSLPVQVTEEGMITTCGNATAMDGRTATPQVLTNALAAARTLLGLLWPPRQ